MKTKLFVLIGLLAIILISFFVGNIPAQATIPYTPTAAEQVVLTKNALIRSFTNSLADAIRNLGYTPIIEDRVIASVPMNDISLSSRVPNVWYIIKIAQFPDWPGEEINYNQTLTDPNNFAGYATHIIATAPSESWCPGTRPDNSQVVHCIGLGCEMTTAPGGISLGSTPVVSGSGTLAQFFQALEYLPAEYSDMVAKFHTLFDGWTPGMPYPGASSYTPLTRSMNAAEITQFFRDNSGYVNPYLIFTSGGVFGDPANWTYQQHYWYDQAYQSNTGQQCPGSYCSGVAEAHRDPFKDNLAQCTVSSPYNRVDSKGNVYSIFDAGTSYSVRSGQ